MKQPQSDQKQPSSKKDVKPVATKQKAQVNSNAGRSSPLKNNPRASVKDQSNNSQALKAGLKSAKRQKPEKRSTSKKDKVDANERLKLSYSSEKVKSNKNETTNIQKNLEFFNKKSEDIKDNTKELSKIKVEDDSKKENNSAKKQVSKVIKVEEEQGDGIEYGFDLYKHMKANMKNREKLCHDPLTKDSKYCIECKKSVCPLCPDYEEHKEHELINKYEYYKLDKDIIDAHFKDIDLVFDMNPQYLDINKLRGELKVHVDTHINKLISQLKDVREKKFKEIDTFFGEDDNSLEVLKENENKIKKNIEKFFNEQKKFFCIDLNETSSGITGNAEKDNLVKNLLTTNSTTDNKNKDHGNANFLLSYDLLKHTQGVNLSIKEILNDIKETYENFVNGIKTDSEVCENDIKKLGESYDKLFKYPFLKADFYKGVLSKLNKYKDQISEMKKYIYEKVNKKGTFEDIEKENKIDNTTMKKTFQSILNSQLVDKDEATTIRTLGSKMHKGSRFGLHSSLSKRSGVGLSPKMKEGSTVLQNIYESPEEIILDKDSLQEYFAFKFLSTVNKYFRTKKKEAATDYGMEDFDEDDFAKPIPGTDEIHIYDRKTRTITKKKVNFDKKKHKYLYFLNGCRCVAIKDKLYITGGVDKEKNESKCAYVYYTKTNELKTMPDMQKSHAYHAIEFLDYYKSIIVIGGENNNGTELYDMNTGMWRELPNLNIGRAHTNIYLDKLTHRVYAFFGILGNMSEMNNFTDSIEVLELRRLALGWERLDYYNKAEMTFKTGISKIFPLSIDMLLVYGAGNKRDLVKKAAIYMIQKQEMVKIDNQLYRELRETSKKSKKLEHIINSFM